MVSANNSTGPYSSLASGGEIIDSSGFNKLQHSSIHYGYARLLGLLSQKNAHFVTKLFPDPHQQVCRREVE